MQKAAQAYLQTQVTTTTQGELLLLLYDGAIKFLTQAKERIAVRDFAGKGILISKALDIVNELDASLNVEKGGDLAENLHKLYFYCSTRLLNANLKMDTGLIDEVIKILSGLRSAYGQIVGTPEAQAVGASMAATRGPANAATRVPIPPTQMPPLGMPAQFGRAHAQAYAQSGQPGDAARPEATTPATAPATPAPASQPSSPVAAAPQPPAASAPAAPAASAHAAPATDAGTGAGRNDAPENAEDGTAQEAPPQGFATRRLAAANLYRKFAQG